MSDRILPSQLPLFTKKIKIMNEALVDPLLHLKHVPPYPVAAASFNIFTSISE
jgi:hypothetical protein